MRKPTLFGMPAEPTDPIIQQYPDLFDLASAPWNSSMQFGIQVATLAWRDIIEQLCKRLQPMAAAAREQGIDFRIVAVKAKFGTLRINYRGGTDEIEAEIDRAQQEAVTPPDTRAPPGLLR